MPTNVALELTATLKGSPYITHATLKGSPYVTHATLRGSPYIRAYASSQRNRLAAIAANIAAKPTSTATGKTAPLRPMPRHVIASRPSTAHRTGTTIVTCCSHAGKMNVG